MTTSTLTREQLSTPIPRTVRTLHTGSSGALVRIVQRSDGALAAVKTSQDPRVPARVQAEARDAIAPLFGDHLPGVLFAGRRQGHDVLITKAPSACTLADRARMYGATPTLLAVWQEFTRFLTRVWQDSARPGYIPHRATRNHQQRVSRALDGLAAVATGLRLPLNHGVWHRMIVNGADCGSWRLAHSRLLDLPSPAVHVACQGDPQPANLVLDEVNGWHLIDWEWSGRHHDWRMLVSHLMGWWYVQELSTHGAGNLSVADGSLRLDYRTPDTSMLNAWTTTGADAFRAMSDRSHWIDDRNALLLHIALLLLRELPRAAADGRTHLIAPLLGEAVRMAGQANGGPPHPLLRSLADAADAPGGRR